MTREQKMQAVVDAAKILADSAGVIWGRTPEDADTYTHELEHIRELMATIAALDALPAQPQPPGETVTLAVWDNKRGNAFLAVAGTPSDDLPEAFQTDVPWRRLGTVTLPLDREAGR